jgi:hypothetical protein
VSAGAGVRLLAVVAAAVGMCALALSATIPSLAASKAGDALITAASGGPGALRAADQQAALAARLDPLSDAGLIVESTIALDRGDLMQSRAFALQALDRNPTDIAAWQSLSYVEILVHQLRDGIRAAQRILELDPEGVTSLGYAGGVAEGATAQLALPQFSPTNTPTP